MEAGEGGAKEREIFLFHSENLIENLQEWRMRRFMWKLFCRMKVNVQGIAKGGCPWEKRRSEEEAGYFSFYDKVWNYLAF